VNPTLPPPLPCYGPLTLVVVILAAASHDGEDYKEVRKEALLALARVIAGACRYHHRLKMLPVDTLLSTHCHEARATRPPRR